MVRLARLDAPGMIHHVMVRGVERRRLFLDDRDYEEFLGRIPRALEKAPCRVLAWALMPNHVHLLVRSGDRGLASFMRRLMTGYAMAFNRRHRRVGHLVQNRFKSIVCEEDPYFDPAGALYPSQSSESGSGAGSPGVSVVPLLRPWRHDREGVASLAYDGGCSGVFR